MHTWFRLDGRIALVTGGAGQYGRCISEGLAKAGAHVVISSLKKEESADVVANLQAQGFSVSAIELDLSAEDHIRQCITEIVQTFGQLDILVNNAVSREGNDMLADLEWDAWEKSERVNGIGTVMLTKLAIGQMLEQGKGNIINISSIMGVTGPFFPMYEHNGEMLQVSGPEYTYTKWGLVGFTKWLATYYGANNIRANCISPGGLNLEGTPAEIKDDHIRKMYLMKTPMQRFANERDLQGPVVFLASDASDYVNGHNLVVDGGYTSW